MAGRDAASGVTTRRQGQQPASRRLPSIAAVAIAAVAIVLVLGSSTPATAQTNICNGEQATIVGNDSDNVLIGTEGRDVIVGHGGDDEITGLGGDDVICGGDGNDRLAGNAGHDWIDAGEGDDWVGAGWGNDTVFGRDGNDFIRGFKHDDTVDGGAGNDTIRGGWGNDVLRGGDGNDVIRAYYGADRLFGNSGNDVLLGSFGPDFIVGGPGKADQLFGQQGTADDCNDVGTGSVFNGCEQINGEDPPTVTVRPDADRVIGNGAPASCTSQAVVAAVAAGGVIAFNCGPNPVTIPMQATAKVVNANGPEIVIDGGDLVTLDGQNQRRILYMNTCDQAQGWTTPHCQNQDHPRLTVENLTFINGNASGSHDDGGGGGAIFVRGGRFEVINSTFVDNRCDSTGPDVGGAALRVLSQYQGLPVEVSGSTFRNGVCSNGGAISSIGVSWVITDSVMTNNRAIGNGANPAQSGTPGGGSGGAIYLDGNLFTVTLRNTQITGNRANEGGGAIFFVSNNRTGTMSINGSTLRNNPSDGFETNGYPGIFYLGNGAPSISNSTLE
jgi:hypothetical protein